MTKKNELGSFRDPSGRIYYQNGKVFREISPVYKDNYEALMSGGLYQKLVDGNLLVSHREVKAGPNVYKVIAPTIIPFISYPYEWCFSELKAAALLTLKIERLSLRRGMNLKDASAFNVQFIGKKPIFIDTLSFEKYVPGTPWIAYRQFCQHFLAPLALMAYTDNRLSKLLGSYLDGIPLDLAAKLLPVSAKINFGIFGHLILNAKSQQVLAAATISKNKYQLSQQSLENLIDSLTSTVKGLQPKKRQSTWGDYYSHTNYDQKSFDAKGDLVLKFLKGLPVTSVLDLGANNGFFSDLVAVNKAYVVSADYDEPAVEANFTRHDSDSVLPLVIDFMNPSPNLGWANQERKSFWQRANFDVIMMLATIHHLAIANNLPFSAIADLIKDHCRYLIIEFIGKQDSQVKILLSQREDIFTIYDQTNFETEFGRYFKIIKKQNITNSHRCLYLMAKK